MRTDLEPFAMVPRDLITTVKPRALQVWCLLAQWSDAEERQTRPTLRRIAGELGISYNAVERALAELEKTGRLLKKSGKEAGRGNEYTLILTKARAPKMGEASPKNGRPHIKVVKEPLKEEPPNPPKGGGGVNPLWTRFEAAYPIRERMAAAEAEFYKLTAAEQAEAAAGAEVLRQIYEAAPAERKRYTVRPHRYLTERRFEAPPAQLEAHYAVPGLFAEARRDQTRRAASEALKREWEEMQALAAQQRLDYQAAEAAKKGTQ